MGVWLLSADSETLATLSESGETYVVVKGQRGIEYQNGGSGEPHSMPPYISSRTSRASTKKLATVPTANAIEPFQLAPP